MPGVHTVHVPLGGDAYDIHIAPGLLDRVGELAKPLLRGGPVLVVGDASVAAHHGERLLASLRSAGLTAHLATFPAGEPNKSVATAETLWQACAEHRIDRSGALIALGGGVSGDLCGFVASCWMRGIDFVQVPTSLLAMVDSSVGGKTGVNSAAGKNLVGAFKQPRLVVIDPTLLATMDGREYRAGLAEVLKYGIINDPAFFAWQEANAEALVAGDSVAVAHAVAESCRIKAHYVAADPFEKGIRAHLNYGHTFGHALERETGYKKYLHGEAVAIGMRMAANLAQRLGLLPDYAVAQRQDALLRRYKLPIEHISADPINELPKLVAHCRLDKKVQGGLWRFILPTSLGTAVTSDAPQPDDVQAAFRHAIVGG
jgi:3-dehydroquinate synthase